jgi:hypothetical protein
MSANTFSVEYLIFQYFCKLYAPAHLWEKKNAGPFGQLPIKRGIKAIKISWDDSLKEWVSGMNDTSDSKNESCLAPHFYPNYVEMIYYCTIYYSTYNFLIKVIVSQEFGRHYFVSLDSWEVSLKILIGFVTNFEKIKGRSFILYQSTSLSSGIYRRPFKNNLVENIYDW